MKERMIASYVVAIVLEGVGRLQSYREPTHGSILRERCGLKANELAKKTEDKFTLSLL